MRRSLIALLKDHLQEDFLNLCLGRLAVLGDGHRNSSVNHRLQLVVAGRLKSYIHAAVSPFYFFGPAFRMSKAAMVATLPMAGKVGKQAYPVSQTAAGCTHSASMLHHARLNAALGLPDDHGIHASDMGVRGVAIKSFVSQAHSLVEKGFMVHRKSMSGLGLVGHSYFLRGS